MSWKQRITRFGWLGVVLMLSLPLRGQSLERPSVGVVLSGGGARGAAHVGFLMALEERGVPIDFIVGSSVGALVGGYYASGWSPSQMRNLLGTEEFVSRISGEPLWQFSHSPQDLNPSLINLRFSRGQGLIKGHLVSSLPLDWALMEELAPAAACSAENFDSLMIPFRCVGSDVLNKTDTVFRTGDVGSAIRASISFPFYLNPLWMDGRPIYDGGLYNNIPVDVMVEEFHPDVILISQVTADSLNFESDDLLTQIEALITRPKNAMEFTNSTFISAPSLPSGTFEFGDLMNVWQVGFDEANRMIDSLPTDVLTMRDPMGSSDINELRHQFQEKLPLFSVKTLKINGLNEVQSSFLGAQLSSKNDQNSSESLKRSLFLLHGNDHFGRIRPQAIWVDSLGGFEVNLEVREERNWKIGTGGSFSSLSNGFGYVHLQHHRFRRTPMSTEISAAFGSFYSSLKSSVRWDFNKKIPFALEPYFLDHGWNFSRRLPNFVQPANFAFASSYDQEWGLTLKIPTGHHGILQVRGCNLRTADYSYSDWLFNPLDSADLSEFNGLVGSIEWKRRKLDRAQFPTKGNMWSARIQRFSGLMEYDLASSGEGEGASNLDEGEVGFWRIQSQAQGYIDAFRDGLVVGFNAKACLSNESIRATYRSSLLQAVSYQPMLGSRSRLMEGFSAYDFVGFGGIIDWRFANDLHMRFESHLFQSFGRIVQEAKGPVVRTGAPSRIMSGIWFYTDLPVGLISMGLEYYESERSPYLFEIHWGKRLFETSSRQ